MINAIGNFIGYYSAGEAYNTPPDYSLLSGNIEGIWDSTGLVENTTNDYGTVDADGLITSLKSIAPGPTDRPFASHGIAPELKDGVIYFHGDGRLRHATAATWNFMHYNATFANLKWTMHCVCLFEDIPGGVFGLIGNNGSSSSSKGISFYFNDATSANDNSIFTQITNGTGYIISGEKDGSNLTPRVWKVLSIVTDCSQAAASRQKVYLDGVLQDVTISAPSSTPATTPTYGLDLGSVGNAVLNLVGCVSHLVIQSKAELNSDFITSLTPQTTRPIPERYIVDRSRTYSESVWLDENSYYLNVSVKQSPITRGTILAVFGNWTSSGHTWSETNSVQFRKSTDGGKTWTTKAAAFDPSGTRGVLDVGFFFDSNGVGHGFANTADGTGTTPSSGTSKLHYFTTTDNGGTWSNSEVTPPSDGLTVSVGYGNGYTANGYNWFCVYRQNNNASESARYILKWALGADISTIEWILVEQGATYINEGSIAYLGGTSHVLICRNEATFEWTQYVTDDDWATNTNQGDLTFGETSTTGNPVRIEKFYMDDVGDVLACYYPLRGVEQLKIIYAKCEQAFTKAHWNTSTKTTIVDGSSGNYYHYGSACHFNNNMNAFMIYTVETADATSNLITSNVPSTQYLTVKSALS